MKTIIIFTLLLLSVMVNAQSGEVCFEKNVLTIGVHGTLTDCEPPGWRTARGSDLDEIKKKIKAKAIGAGFVYEYKNEKYIITCEHVVFRASDIRGYDANYKAYPLEIVGRDIFYDVAVLKFKNKHDSHQFNPMQIDNSSVASETFVHSIGFWNLDGTINQHEGKVIEVNDRIDSDEVVAGKIGFLRTTARLLKGYSGGPLYDPAKSMVVGMNTKRHDGFERYYSLQGNILERIVHEIIDSGVVKRSYLGVRFSQPKNENEGVKIDAVLNDSPASPIRKKLIDKQVIKINNDSIKTIYDVLEIMENIPPGTEIDIALLTSEGKIDNVGLMSDAIDGECLKQIAIHAIREDTNDQYTDIEEQNNQVTLIKDDKKVEIPETVGFRLNDEDFLIYCLNDLVQFGALTRLLGTYGRLEIDNDPTHIFPTEIRLSPTPNQRVLYY